MKHITKTLTMAAVVLMGTFTACKKNNTEPKPEVKPIIAEELLGYQIVAAFSSPAKNVPPKLFHFAKSGNEIMATMDGVQSRRIRATKVTDNRFTFDSDDDGKFVYEFNFKRDENGLIIMASSKYHNGNDPSITMPNAVIWPSGFPGFKGKTFNSVDGTNYELKFATDTWTFSPVAGKTGTFYEIAKGAWKGRLDGKDYMGFSAPAENNKVAMALTREDSEVFIAFQ